MPLAHTAVMGAIGAIIWSKSVCSLYSFLSFFLSLINRLEDHPPIVASSIGDTTSNFASLCIISLNIPTFMLANAWITTTTTSSHDNDNEIDQFNSWQTKTITTTTMAPKAAWNLELAPKAALINQQMISYHHWSQPASQLKLRLGTPPKGR